MKKYMIFMSEKEIVFIDSKQFFKYSLKTENLSENVLKDEFKYLSQEFQVKQLKSVKKKGIYWYDYMNNLKKYEEEKLPKKTFTSC